MTLETLTNTGFRQAAVYQRIANFEHHFVGVSKMVNAEGRELEEKIAENVAELLEA